MSDETNGAPARPRICADLMIRVVVEGDSYEAVGGVLDRIAATLTPENTGLRFAHMTSFNRRPCPGAMNPYEQAKRAEMGYAEPMAEQTAPMLMGDDTSF
jgi:hypothetical protein